MAKAMCVAEKRIEPLAISISIFVIILVIIISAQNMFKLYKGRFSRENYGLITGNKMIHTNI